MPIIIVNNNSRKSKNQAPSKWLVIIVAIIFKIYAITIKSNFYEGNNKFSKKKMRLLKIWIKKLQLSKRQEISLVKKFLLRMKK